MNVIVKVSLDLDQVTYEQFVAAGVLQPVIPLDAPGSLVFVATVLAQLGGGGRPRRGPVRYLPSPQSEKGVPGAEP